MTLEDVRNAAKEKLKGICGVYRVCDGDPSRLCQNQSYGGSLGIGGAGSGASFANNIKDLARVQLKMLPLGRDFSPDTSVSLFGADFKMPVYGAPATGVNSFGGESVISEADFCRATVEGCKAAGTLAWRGDTYTYSPESPWGIRAIAAAGGQGIKIIKPRDQEVIKKFIQLAEQAGALAVGVDIDGCGSYMMKQHGQPVYRKSLKDISELVQSTQLPFIVKGVMTVEDARDAVKAGAAAIVVSNHGGRVLDHTPGTAAVLPAIAEAVGGQITILADGGVRTGYDVLKMLALGAQGVLVGRDIVRAAVGAGAEGVRIHMEYLQKTLVKAMLMTGCRSLQDISREILAL